MLAGFVLRRELLRVAVELEALSVTLDGDIDRNFVTKQIRRSSDIPRRFTLQTKDVVNKTKRIPFITTFNPSLPQISNIIK